MPHYAETRDNILSLAEYEEGEILCPHCGKRWSMPFVRRFVALDLDGCDKKSKIGRRRIQARPAAPHRARHKESRRARSLRAIDQLCSDALISVHVSRHKSSSQKKTGDIVISKHIAIVGMLASFTCVAQTIQPAGSPDVSPPKLERMPELLEVGYALSAAPPHLRDGATTYVLDPSKGYLPNHRGSNGVSCIVVRSDWQWADRPFRDDIAWPICFDAEGSKTLLQDYIYTAELRVRGRDAKQVHLEVTKRFGTKDFPNPARSGVAYMIAPVMRGWTRGQSQ
jgi:hypothetical protein